jgi:hypothetical protein
MREQLQLKYVGGPLHGQHRKKQPDEQWPPRSIKHIDGSGAYLLRRATLEWRVAKSMGDYTQ